MTSMTEHVAPAIVEASRTPGELADIVGLLAARPDAWMARVRLRADGRWYERLHCGADYDVWLIAWLPGQGTGFHDHGASAGAFAVASGSLAEHRPGHAPREVRAGERLSFAPYYAHDVRNASSAPAISIHAYSPPLTEMTHYDLDGAELVPQVTPPASREDARDVDTTPGPGPAAWGIDDVLAGARARLHRLSPLEAYRAVASGACLVDIRPAAQRESEGAIPGALVVERNVLEWRFDPRCEARLAAATGYGVHVIVLCSEGYTSSLAAAALQDLGLWRATDVIGGFHAWHAAGLPTSRKDTREPSPVTASSRRDRVT